MRPSGIQLRFLLSSLVNGCLFSQSGFHVFPDVYHHTLDGTSPSRVTHFPFMSPYLWRIMSTEFTKMVCGDSLLAVFQPIMILLGNHSKTGANGCAGFRGARRGSQIGRAHVELKSRPHIV